MDAHAKRAVVEKRAELEAAVARLESAAGGAPEGAREGVASWKARLTGESLWEDVAAAAGTYLLTGPKVSKRLKGPHGEAAKARVAYERTVEDVAGVGAVRADAEDSLLARCDHAFLLSLATQLEMYFVEALTRMTKEKAKGELQRRIAGMAEKEVDPDLIQPVLWRKVQGNLGP